MESLKQNTLAVGGGAGAVGTTLHAPAAIPTGEGDTMSTAHVGADKMKALCEDLIACWMFLQGQLFELGRLASEAAAHDLKDDKYHPVVMEAFREILQGCGDIDDALEGDTSLRLADVYAAATRGYEAAQKGCEIDYAAVDGEAVQRAVVVSLQSVQRHTKEARDLRGRIEKAAGERGRPKKGGDE